MAREHGVTRWQVYDWPCRLRLGQLSLPENTPPLFVPLMEEEVSLRPERPPRAAPAKAEIVIDDMVIRTVVDLEDLAQVIRTVRSSR